MNTIKEIAKDHIQYKGQILKLAKSDLKKTYKGASLGWAWAVIKPATQIFVYWFTFSVGLRSGRPVEGFPYFLWLIAGLIPWFYMRDMLNSGTNCMRRYSYLVTKIKFPVSIIPSFMGVSMFFIHIVLLLITCALFMLFGFKPDIYWLQLPVYMIMMFLFFVAWALFGGLLAVMSKDFLNLVKTITTALFWLSGILYDPNGITQVWIRRILMFNPVTIITSGYRNCFIYKQWFWENPQLLINFGIMFVIMILLSLWAYKKLRKELADVL